MSKYSYRYFKCDGCRKGPDRSCVLAISVVNTNDKTYTPTECVDYGSNSLIARWEQMTIKEFVKESKRRK